MRGWSELEGISYNTPILRMKKDIQKWKVIMWKPKSVRDQSQKLAWIISFQGFELKVIKKGKYHWTISCKKCSGKNQKNSGLEVKKNSPKYFKIWQKKGEKKIYM